MNITLYFHISYGSQRRSWECDIDWSSIPRLHEHIELKLEYQGEEHLLSITVEDVVYQCQEYGNPDVIIHGIVDQTDSFYDHLLLIDSLQRNSETES